jgi:hypothetical protein
MLPARPGLQGTNYGQYVLSMEYLEEIIARERTAAANACASRMVCPGPPPPPRHLVAVRLQASGG